MFAEKVQIDRVGMDRVEKAIAGLAGFIAPQSSTIQSTFVIGDGAGAPFYAAVKPVTRDEQGDKDGERGQSPKRQISAVRHGKPNNSHGGHDEPQSHGSDP